MQCFLFNNAGLALKMHGTSGRDFDTHGMIARHDACLCEWSRKSLNWLMAGRQRSASFAGVNLSTAVGTWQWDQGVSYINIGVQWVSCCRKLRCSEQYCRCQNHCGHYRDGTVYLRAVLCEIRVNDCQTSQSWKRRVRWDSGSQLQERPVHVATLIPQDLYDVLGHDVYLDHFESPKVQPWILVGLVGHLTCGWIWFAHRN